MIQDYLVLHQSDLAADENTKSVPVGHLVANLDRWLSSVFTRRLLYEMYEVISGNRMDGLLLREPSTQEQVRHSLREAFRNRVLVAIPNGPLRLKTASASNPAATKAPMEVPLLEDNPKARETTTAKGEVKSEKDKDAPTPTPELKSVDKEAPHDEAQDDTRLEPEFVKPLRPGDGKLLQWVNLDANALKKGTDGNGHEVEFEVGAKGDRDASTGVTKPETVGAPGQFVFIKVIFRGPGGKKGKRTTPATDLVAGLDLVERTVVKNGVNDAEWEFTGKVELKSPGGIGVFKVELGLSGGDTCEIELGSTEALGGPKLLITNWRKLWYEMLAPDFMQLEEWDAPGLGRVRDFAASGRTNIKTSGDNTFIEYELFKSHSFTEAECPPGTVMKREFFERTTGNAKVYVLTDHSFTLYPKPFDKGKGKRATCLKACDVNMYSEGPGTDAPITRGVTTTTVQYDDSLRAVDPDLYWTPLSGYDGTDTIKKITWTAKIPDPTLYHSRPRVEFDADVDSSTAEEGTLSIHELLQNGGPTVISFKALPDGELSTELDATATASLEGLLSGLYTIATLREHGNKLKFQLTGRLGDKKRTRRFRAVKDYLRKQVAAAAPLVPTHPGLDDSGTPRTGDLDWKKVVNMDRSHHQQISIDLPALTATDPGSFVGSLNATHCNVKLTISFEPQHAANGQAGIGAQRGEILVTWGINCPLSVTDTFLHELGHQYNMAVVARGRSTGPTDHKWSNAESTHAPGLPVPKTISENETDANYQFNGAKGHNYTVGPHSGPHCAWGLSDMDKQVLAGKNGVCTMYGEGPRDDTLRTRLSFCKQCTDYIRARDLSALK